MNEFTKQFLDNWKNENDLQIYDDEHYNLVTLGKRYRNGNLNSILQKFDLLTREEFETVYNDLLNENINLRNYLILYKLQSI